MQSLNIKEILMTRLITKPMNELIKKVRCFTDSLNK